MGGGGRDDTHAMGSPFRSTLGFADAVVRPVAARVGKTHHRLLQDFQRRLRLQVEIHDGAAAVGQRRFVGASGNHGRCDTKETQIKDPSFRSVLVLFRSNLVQRSTRHSISMVNMASTYSLKIASSIRSFSNEELT